MIKKKFANSFGTDVVKAIYVVVVVYYLGAELLSPRVSFAKNLLRVN